jgi:cation diffusion facilitator CzcD-associated flavoprotein CzcO
LLNVLVIGAQFEVENKIIANALDQYLEALVRENVTFIPQGIKEITENGIVATDGNFREVDAIICATGFAGLVPIPHRL